MEAAAFFDSFGSAPPTAGPGERCSLDELHARLPAVSMPLPAAACRVDVAVLDAIRPPTNGPR